MTSTIAALPSVGELYDERLGEFARAESPAHIPLWLPYQQGDVFTGVDLLGSSTHLAMLFMHPCTMRAAGGAVREFVTVVEVAVHSPKKVVTDPERWIKSFKVMPLPNVLGDGTSTHVGDFMKIMTIPSLDIPRTRRIAQLSLNGRLAMQQRIVHHITRYAPKLPDLDSATAAVELEAEAQGDWVQAATADSAPTLEDVAKYETDFQDFLSTRPGDVSLRDQIKLPESRASASRTIQREIAKRYPGRTGPQA